jgi:hypothetical protein
MEEPLDLDLYAEQPLEGLEAEELPTAAAHGSWSTVSTLSSYGGSIATLACFACQG